MCLKLHQRLQWAATLMVLVRQKNVLSISALVTDRNTFCQCHCKRKLMWTWKGMIEPTKVNSLTLEKSTKHFFKSKINYPGQTRSSCSPKVKKYWTCQSHRIRALKHTLCCLIQFQWDLKLQNKLHALLKMTGNLAKHQTCQENVHLATVGP